MSDFRILVVGAGATGGYFGGRLLQAGRDVTFLVRPARAKLLRERGLRIVGLGEETVLEPALVETGEPTGPYDLVLFAVKATAVPAAIEDLAPAVGPGTLIMPFLNGMKHLDDLAARFGAPAVLGGVAKVQTTVDGAGDIRRLGELQELRYGALDAAQTPERLAVVDSALGGAGYPAGIATDILGEMWAKWVMIAAMGGVTCLMRGTIGDVEAVPGGRGFAEAVLAEAASVAAAAGHPVEPDELTGFRAMVTAAGSPAAPSLYRDLVGGHPLEVEQLLGDFVARAAGFGVAVPKLDLATLQLRVHQARLERG